MTEISKERAKLIKDATDLENLLKQPGWKIIQKWFDDEKKVADTMLHDLGKNDTFDMMNAKITFNLIIRIEQMIEGIIRNKYKLIEVLDPLMDKSKLRRKNEKV